MKQEEIIEQRRKEFLKREEKKEQELIKNQNELHSAKKIDELWDRLLEANKKLDPIIRLSTRVGYENNDSNWEVQTIGPLFRYKTGVMASSYIYRTNAAIFFNGHYMSYEDGCIQVRRNSGIFESDNNNITFTYPYKAEYNNRKWPLRIVYDIEKGTFVFKISENIEDNGNFYEMNLEDVDVLLNNIISGAVIWNGLKKPKGGCFIATAVYGTPYSNEVLVLKEFRDNWLLNYSLGRVFVRFYYKVSPPIANQIAKRQYLKEITKTILIIPLITLANYLKRKEN